MDNRKTVLLVEDEAVISLMMSESVKKFGYNVLHVNSGEKAIRLCTENDAIDLILMDLDLGRGIQGPEAAREILRIKNIPIVFLTAHSGQVMVESVLGIQHFGYVIKNSGEYLLKSSIEMALQLFNALERVKAGEKNYHEIFDCSNDALFIHDNITGKILDVNKTMLTMYGYSSKYEVLNTDSDDFGAYGEGYTSKKGIGLVFRTLESGHNIFEWRARRKNGEIFWAEVSLTRIKISGVDRIIAAVRDISRRKEYEQKLIESESRFKSIIELAPDAILLGNPEGVIIGANERASEITGYSSDELIGTKIQAWFSEEELKRAPFRFDLLKQGLVVRTDRNLIRKNGMEVFIEMNSKMMPDGSYQTFIRDMSERKLAEDKLAAEKERLAVTLRSIGDGVITTDMFCNVVIMNKVAEDLTGWRQQEAEGRPLPDVFSIMDESSRTQCDNPALKVLETGEIKEFETGTVLVSRDGTERIISDSGAPIRDNNNSVIGVVIVFRDMTEKRKLFEAVQQADRLNSLGVLAGGIAHDFNNLLNGIFGYVEMARLKNTGNDEVSAYLDKTFTVFNRAKDLTQQLLTFSKGGMPNRKTGNIGPLIRDNVSFALSGSNITCEYYIDDNLPLCDFDENQIAQVIDNIVINAVQAMPAGGKLVISAKPVLLDRSTGQVFKGGSCIRISIADTGIGIPHDLIKRIFDPFFTTKQQGNGLGLATCYSIIRNHEGFIDAESVPGKGSVFNIFLPVSEKKGDYGIKTAPVRVPGTGKILIMDDEEFIRDISSDMLKMEGYSTVEASDGVEALKLLSEAEKNGEVFDGAILDLTIPGGMGGQATLNEIRKRYPGMPVFASSGFSESPVISNPGDFGFTASIRKPYRREELMELLNTHIRK